MCCPARWWVGQEVRCGVGAWIPESLLDAVGFELEQRRARFGGNKKCTKLRVRCRRSTQARVFERFDDPTGTVASLFVPGHVDICYMADNANGRSSPKSFARFGRADSYREALELVIRAKAVLLTACGEDLHQYPLLCDVHGWVDPNTRKFHLSVKPEMLLADRWIGENGGSDPEGSLG